jgi:hypothetical protein
VQVVCRFRPLNKLELSKGAKVCIGNLTKDAVQLKVRDSSFDDSVAVPVSAAA